MEKHLDKQQGFSKKSDIHVTIRDVTFVLLSTFKAGPNYKAMINAQILCPNTFQSLFHAWYVLLDV